MENIIDIYNLLPEEITEAIEKLTDALDIIKNRKNTNARFVDNNKERKVSPHCQSINIIKNGHDKNKVQTYQYQCPYYHSTCIIKNGHDKNKVQTYKCKDCRKKFNDCSATLVAHIKLTYEQLTTFFECMNDKLSIRKTAVKMKVNPN